MRHPAWTRRLFTDDDLEAIAAAIAAAERETSAEIRVHLERRLPPPAEPDALPHARDVFGKLGMHRTAERSAVLIYLAVEDRKLAIVGDEGVHARVGAAYWKRIRDEMVTALREGAPRAALVTAVRDVGSVLRRHFPRRPGDENELQDDVSVS